MDMEIVAAKEQIKYAIEQKQEELIYTRWINGYDKEIGFKEFKDSLLEIKNHKDEFDNEEDILKWLFKEVG